MLSYCTRENNVKGNSNKVILKVIPFSYSILIHVIHVTVIRKACNISFFSLVTPDLTWFLLDRTQCFYHSLFMLFLVFCKNTGALSLATE